MNSDLLAEVVAATAARSSTQSEAEGRWRAAIRAAVAAGEPRTLVAQTAGISRGRLYQILGEES